MRNLSLFLVSLFATFSIFAGVNLKNGNFYISYTDIIVPGGGNKLEITRTYNSKSTKMGWFGIGWGSEFETRLVPAPDGSVVIHENGSGAETRFTPKGAVNAEASAGKIISKIKEKTGMTDDVANKLKNKLLGDAELRRLYAQKFSVTANVATGTTLYSTDRGLQRVKKVNDGFRRYYNDGKIEYFNNIGIMIKIVDRNGYTVNLNYNGKELKSIKDSQAKQLFFEWYSDRKMKGVWSSGEKKASYKYRGKDLVESQDVGGNVYAFEYDSNHNLISVGYQDKSKMQVKYTQKTQFVKEIVNRNGDSTKYEYGADPSKPDMHYWTLVTKKGISGKPVTNRYEYEIKARNDGSQYTYRIYTIINNIKNRNYL